MLCYCKLLLVLSKTSWTWVCFVYSYITCSLSGLKLINIGIHESIAIDILGMGCMMENTVNLSWS